MVEHLQAYLVWRETESKAREASDNFAAAIKAGRYPSEAEMGELSRLRTAASAALHDMIELAKGLPERPAQPAMARKHVRGRNGMSADAAWRQRARHAAVQPVRLGWRPSWCPGRLLHLSALQQRGEAMRFDDSDETGLAAGHAARAANDKVFSRVEGAAASMREAANDRHASDDPHPAPIACTGNAGAPACGLSVPSPV